MRTMPLGMINGEIIPLTRPSRRRGFSQYGDYDVVTPLARGGMGGVYLAVHTVTRERVALKVLDSQLASSEEVVARLYAEQAVSARASHPGLIDIRASARNLDGIPYLVMEYLEGETLAAIAEHATLEIPAILRITAQVAAALAALHDAGVIHCDVKHENVFVLAERTACGWPKVKVLDFGVSRFVDEPAYGDGAIAGTPWCMAPEQWAGKPCPQSDVYSLGCMLFELTTGCAPFDGSLPEIMHAHLSQRPSRPSWLRAMPLDLERLILRALAKEPALRPTMHEMASALTELHEQLTELRASA
jgi:eukaryotic-like serine/threonine-protein kinase